MRIRATEERQTLVQDKQVALESRLAELRNNAELGFGGIAVEQLAIPEADWAIQWRDSFPPLPITNAITIVPDWDTNADAEVLVRIHPARAFGTGHHATTALVISLMDQLGCRGKHILDLGTGSGILAITALKLGAKSVVAVEHDPECLENFQNNVALNYLMKMPVWRDGDATIWSDFNFDLIVANIQRCANELCTNQIGGAADHIGHTACRRAATEGPLYRFGVSNFRCGICRRMVGGGNNTGNRRAVIDGTLRI